MNRKSFHPFSCDLSQLPTRITFSHSVILHERNFEVATKDRDDSQQSTLPWQRRLKVGDVLRFLSIWLAKSEFVQTLAKWCKMISDAQLDNLVERFMSDHGILVGHSLMFRHLQSLGLRVQRDRIRESNLPHSRQNLMRTWYSSLIWMFALTLSCGVFQSRPHSCRRSRAVEKRSCQCNTCVSGL